MGKNKIDKALQQTVAMFGDCTKIEQLWTNVSLGSAFAAQTINVANLSNYDMYMITYRAVSSENNVMTTIANVGEGTYLIGNIPLGQTNNRIIAGRRFVQAGSDKFTFSMGKYDAYENATYLVPIQIYGIKM